MKQGVSKRKNNEDCFLRLYCRKWRSEYDRSRQRWVFTLRDKELCVDQMEDLSAAVDCAAKVWAKALANCYWVAHIDVNNSEWVFGLSRAV